MTWISCRLVVSLVTGKAVGWSPAVGGRVTRNAGRRGVSARQGERGRTVIESRRVPGSGRVTGRAVVIKIVRHVIGVGYSREIRLVTGVACGRRIDITGRVARNA